ncbi:MULTISPECIES: TolC family protein [unclassified Helicobacter]|uniref:TolC family protein n=1 Tax=unclassified Helicobacter TaxID=2593540 RepID=UPI002161ABAD|nr:MULTISPECIES: TolC family protein [unclassified Helicobacter]
MNLRIFLLAFLVVFSACTTKIPTAQELESKNHIPQAFRNYTKKDSAQEAQNAQNTQEAQNLQSKDSKNPQNNTQSKKFKADSHLKQFSLLFNDKDLEKLLTIALERNSDVLIMISRIEQAKAQAKINTASLFPTINAGLNTNYTDRRTQSQNLTVRPGTNSVNASLSMSWELDLFGKLNALRKSSKEAHKQAQSNLANTQLTLIGDVATYYFTLLDNAFSIAQSRDLLKNLEEIEAISKQEYESGLIDINTYKSAMINTTTQKNSMESALYTFEQNKNALLVLLDMNAQELDSYVDFSLPREVKIAEFDIEALPSEVILQRPDVESSIYALYSQLYKETNANAARLPSISLSGSIGELLYSNTTGNSLVFQIANSITTPLFNRTSLKQNYLIQQELSKEAYYTLQKTINTALGEMENALFDKTSKARQVQNLSLALNLSQEAWQIDTQRQANGMIDRSEFLTNENTHLSMRTQFHTSQINEAISMVTLFKAFGGALWIVDSQLQDSANQEKIAQGTQENREATLDSQNIKD